MFDFILSTEKICDKIAMKKGGTRNKRPETFNDIHGEIESNLEELKQQLIYFDPLENTLFREFSQKADMNTQTSDNDSNANNSLPSPATSLTDDDIQIDEVLSTPMKPCSATVIGYNIDSDSDSDIEEISPFEFTIKKPSKVLSEIDSADQGDEKKELGLNPYYFVSQFLDTVHLFQESGDRKGNSPQVVISTIHAAKGLEWPAVFIPCLHNGSIPCFQSVNEGTDSIDEERRCFYVALTRAKEMLFLSYHVRPIPYSPFDNIKSRFLKGIADLPYVIKRQAADYDKRNAQFFQPSTSLMKDGNRNNGNTIQSSPSHFSSINTNSTQGLNQDSTDTTECGPPRKRIKLETVHPIQTIRPMI
ncbi:unnamed protein product [Ambrosiozyma monospora]|uniref:Unnamed protein product n=1 Tax=Ambrosiozyma monospora TaxID=43982 RepID=A0A9W6YYB4_AMBMO|nr:unnamed protein product [Ambrosiozyma monospora]